MKYNLKPKPSPAPWSEWPPDDRPWVVPPNRQAAGGGGIAVTIPAGEDRDLHGLLEVPGAIEQRQHLTAQKRWNYWRNDVRNRLIADIALQAPADEQVLVMVETLEHAERMSEFKKRTLEAGGTGTVRRGIGMASCNHVSGNKAFFPTFDGSSSLVRVAEDGKVTVFHGECDMGQGPMDMTTQYRLLAAGSVVEERIYVGPYEVWRKRVNGTQTEATWTMSVMGPMGSAPLGCVSP
jgi:hypothetical protein